MWSNLGKTIGGNEDKKLSKYIRNKIKGERQL